MYDIVRVYFMDGTSTLVTVSEDDHIHDAIVELCEKEGWDLRDFTEYKIEETIEE